MKRILFIVFLSALALQAKAQKISLETNILDYANLGTLNLEANYGVSQHISLLLGGRYNGWEFEGKSIHDVISNEQITAYAGFRYWPWPIYSGWWFGFKGQWQEYGRGGVWRPLLEEGTAIGAGVTAGYTLMLSPRFNMNFAAGFWGGSKDYTLWNCRYCNRIQEQERGFFIGLDNVYVSLVLVL